MPARLVELSKARYKLLNALDIIAAEHSLTEAEKLYLLAREVAHMQSYVVFDEIVGINDIINAKAAE